MPPTRGFGGWAKLYGRLGDPYLFIIWLGAAQASQVYLSVNCDISNKTYYVTSGEIRNKRGQHAKDVR